MKKENLKQKKGTKGITLVALVVTIVALLILAGITITMLFSDSGIITKAREAADAVDKAQGDTLNGLNDLADDMGVALGEAPKIKEQGKLVPIGTKFAKYTDSTSSDPVPIPGGYCVVKDIVDVEGNVTDANTIASGLVISDLAKDTLDNNANTEGKKGNQFVWVPVSSTQLSRMYDSTNKRGNLYDFNNIDSTTNLPTLITYSESGCCEPEIVTQYDGTDATDNASYFKAAISDTMTGVQFKEQLEKEFYEMIASVQKYGGFYIGRYETQGMTTSNTSAVPTVQKGVMPSTGINWYYHYQESKNIAKDNKNITSSMIWGCQFDRTLEWIVEINLKEDGTKDYELLTTKSKTWGNYKDSEGDAATNSGTGVKLSGTNPAWQKNHIYDLAGNAEDWTLEANYASSRVYRGGSYGSYGSKAPAPFRYGSRPNGVDSNSLGEQRKQTYILCKQVNKRDCTQFCVN